MSFLEGERFRKTSVRCLYCLISKLKHLNKLSTANLNKSQNKFSIKSQFGQRKKLKAKGKEIKYTETVR